MSEAPTQSPICVPSTLLLLADHPDDLLITPVTKKKDFVRASSKTFKKSIKNHHCNSALLDTITNDDSPTTLFADAITSMKNHLEGG